MEGSSEPDAPSTELRHDNSEMQVGGVSSPSLMVIPIPDPPILSFLLPPFLSSSVQLPSPAPFF